jgi:WD40 repeat protein
MDAPQVFLSYNSADRGAVIAVRDLLRARGITTFLDRDNLVTGLPWPQSLEQGLRGACAVAVFIGRQLGAWQKREMWYSLDRQVSEEKQGRAFPVVPVLLPGADLTPGFLFSNTWIDLRNGLDSPEAAKVLDAIERAIKATAPEVATVGERATMLCPYRGLQAFREEDSAFFAGRSAFARQLFGLILRKDLVAVVGPSGSGKSSVVQAGLVPLLRRQRPPAWTWDVASFTPGSDPFHRLASALIPFLEPELGETDRLTESQKLGDRLARGVARLEAVIDRVIAKSNGTGRLLVVADQFEELFTIAPEVGRRTFAQVLLRALGGSPFTLLITLRADFYSQIITLDRELSDRIASAQANIGALTAEELRESVAVPARLVGLDFEPGLADRVLTDAGWEPGSLPLVEFALTELWSRRHDRILTNAAYNEIGGVTGALAKRAETEFASFAPEEQTAARRLFGRLVRVARPEEGAEDTRQRLELQASDAVTEKVAQALARPEVRLLVTGRDDQTRSETVEVAHEALIRNWERLRGWLNEDREFLLWRQRLQVALEGYERSHSDIGSLLRGAPLVESEHWLATRPEDLTDAQRRLVGQSIALREREAVEREQRRRDEIAKAQQLKELAEARADAEQKRAAEQERHAAAQAGQLKRLRRFSVGLLVLLLLAVSAVTFAFWQRALARAHQWVAVSGAIEQKDPELSILFAAHGVAATWPWGHYVLPEAVDQLHRSILASHVRMTLSGHGGPVSSVAWSPDGQRLVSGSWDGTARVWDPKTGKELLTFGQTQPDKTHNTSVAWSPDGQKVATESKVWDVASGRESLILPDSGEVNSISWSANGELLAMGGWGYLGIRSPHTGKELFRLGLNGGGPSFALSRDGERLVAVSAGKTSTGKISSIYNTATVWEVAKHKQSVTISDDRGISQVGFSPDGKRLATGNDYGTVKVWDVGSGKELLALAGHVSVISRVAWSPDGKRLASGSWDGSAKVWDAESGNETLTLSGHNSWIYDVAWSPDGKQLATAGKDGTVKVWDVGVGHELLALSEGGHAIESVAWSPDGARLATVSEVGATKVWDAAGKELLTLTGGNSRAVAWSPDGQRLATGGYNDTSKVWAANNGKEILTLGASEFVRSISWSPDGKRLAVGGEYMYVRVWETGTAKHIRSLDPHEANYVNQVAWSPDGRRLAAATTHGTTLIWETETGRELHILNNNLNNEVGGAWVMSVAWNPNGRRLVTGSEDGTAKMWDADTGKLLFSLDGKSGIVDSVAWSPDGGRLVSASWDLHAKVQTTQVWDAGSSTKLFTLAGQRDRVTTIAWSRDGRRLATASADGTVQVYSMEIHDLMELARQRVTANPSDAGCKSYLQLDKCPPVPVLSWL